MALLLFPAAAGATSLRRPLLPLDRPRAADFPAERGASRLTGTAGRYSLGAAGADAVEI